MSLEAWVLAAMTQLAPGPDHTATASVFARVVESERPLFQRDEDKHRTAGLLVAVSFRESTFHMDAVGDKGQSFCGFQIHRSSGGSPALLTDPEACTRKGLSMLRESLRVCPSHPVAWYASGPIGCFNERARRISNDRMNLAAWLTRKVQ